MEPLALQERQHNARDSRDSNYSANAVAMHGRCERCTSYRYRLQSFK